MRPRHSLLLALVALCLAPLAVRTAAQEAPPARVRALHCGTLLAVPGKPPLREHTVVVRGARVEAVLPGYLPPERVAPGEPVEVIDLRGSFVLPGLIDCHVHLTHAYSARSRLDRVELSDADRAVLGVAHARRTLLAGFTTVRDLGATGDSIFALRDGVARGLIEGPRILAAGEAITPTGGHADETHGYREDLFAVPGPMQGIGDGPAGCRQAVRAQVKRGADVIKVTATGGVLSATAAGTDAQFFPDELQAIVETARLLGRKVAAHAHGTNGIKAALRAGVDSIEHGSFLDDEAIALFRERRAYLVPTLSAGRAVTEWAGRPGFLPPPVAEKARQVGPTIQGALARAWKGGVLIAFGTDAGVGPHGDNPRELSLLVEAGMPPAQALVSATVNAAALLGLERELGTIEPGKAADVIAAAGDPLADVAALATPTFVMRAGVVHAQAR